MIRLTCKADAKAPAMESILYPLTSRYMSLPAAVAISRSRAGETSTPHLFQIQFYEKCKKKICEIRIYEPCSENKNYAQHSLALPRHNSSWRPGVLHRGVERTTSKLES